MEKKKTIHVKKFYKLKDKDVGQSSKKKLKILSNILKKNKIDLLFVSAAENIAWLLNIRGRDSRLFSNTKFVFVC